jgi:uncharacterized membrane protein YphA (DoxX/SURF4 family)
MDPVIHTAGEVRTHPKAEPAYQAYQLLHIGFIVAPTLAGLDKFLNFLTNWEKYLAPQVAAIVPAHTFMMIVGVVEIVAGLVVALKPRIGGIVVAAWLVGIIVNLALVGGYWDVALRDLGLMLGAIALSRLAKVYAP